MWPTSRREEVFSFAKSEGWASLLPGQGNQNHQVRFSSQSESGGPSARIGKFIIEIVRGRRGSSGTAGAPHAGVKPQGRRLRTRSDFDRSRCTGVLAFLSATAHLCARRNMGAYRLCFTAFYHSSDFCLPSQPSHIARERSLGLVPGYAMKPRSASLSGIEFSSRDTIIPSKKAAVHSSALQQLCATGVLARVVVSCRMEPNISPGLQSAVVHKGIPKGRHHQANSA